MSLQTVWRRLTGSDIAEAAAQFHAAQIALMGTLSKLEKGQATERANEALKSIGSQLRGEKPYVNGDGR